MLEEKLKFIFKGGQTKRFHTADMLTPQSVAEHSYGVAWLCMLLAPTARKELLLAALAHDMAEHEVGDVSSPTKRRYPALKAAVDAAEYGALKEAGFDYETGLTDHELRVLKIADIFDGMMYCVRERRFGSLAAVTVYNNFSSYYTANGKQEGDLGFEVYTAINNMWEKYNGSK